MRHASQLLCFLAACGLAHGFQAQAPAKGSIEGQVVNGKTGAPLKRATVRLTVAGLNGVPSPAGLPPAAMGPALANLATAIQNRMPQMMNKETDEQGRFAFTRLEP